MTTGVFARNWRALVEGFLEGSGEVGGLVVRYEDISQGRYEAVEQYLGFGLSRDAARFNPSDGGPPPTEHLPPEELAELDRGLGDLPEKLGYSDSRRNRC